MADRGVLGATEGAREMALREGVEGITDVAREIDGVLIGSGVGAGGRIDHPKKAVRTAVSDGSARVPVGVGVVSRGDGIDGESSSSTVGEGKETDAMIPSIDWT